jgi:hypothetical protein
LLPGNHATELKFVRGGLAGDNCMRLQSFFKSCVAAGGWAFLLTSSVSATEYGFSTYALGGAAFGAGATPPPGTYVTNVTGVYRGEIGGALQFSNVTLNAGAKVNIVTTGLNILYVPERKFLGGSLGLSATVPVGHVDMKAKLEGGPINLFDEINGWGLGDIVPKVQLGWQHGGFAHTLYVQTVAPTGRYDVGFVPIVGLNRPGVDTGWAFTYTDAPTKLQFNGALGVTFNFENDETHYKSGDEFHFEWAVGREFSPGLVVGLVGYDYRQLTGDSGSGANFGAFKGQVDAIGPGVSYTTLLGATPVIINLRHYQEFNVEHRWEGSSTLLSTTVRF